MYLLAALPAITIAVAGYGLRPAQPVLGARRLTLIRTAVAAGSYAILTVELLSVFGWLTRTGVCVMWLLGLVAAVAGAIVRRRRDSGISVTRPEWSKWIRLSPVEWLTVAAMVMIAAATLTVAFAAPPNTWDSQSYHLPKVEQWAAARSVGVFPTPFFSQVALAPGAEYLLLHLRLLTGGDRLYNLVQWSAGLLCAVAVSRVAAQLKVGRVGQFVAAFVVATAPMIIFQATSTQTDLVTAAWSACVATLVMDSAWRRLGATDVFLVGAAAGLAALTKSTGMVAAALMLALWFVARAWRVRSKRAAASLVGATAAVATVTLVIFGPFLTEMTATYGDPLGPPVVRVHGMERHDPAAVLVNGARLLQGTLMVPDEQVNSFTGRAVKKLADLLHINILDPAITRATEFPVPFYAGWNEDLASYPIQVVAVSIGLVFCLVWRRRDPRILGYALACLGTAIGFAATIKWQWFSTRLLLPALVVAAPLAGVAADALVSRARRGARIVASALLAVVVFATGWIGVDAVLHQNFRPLQNQWWTVLTADSWTIRFARSPSYRPDYEWAAAKIRQANAQRVGMVTGGTTGTSTLFEYPWWLLLRGKTLVNLESTVPGHPAPPPSSVDAVICFSPPDPKDCVAHIPPGWTLQSRPSVALALRPTPPRS